MPRLLVTPGEPAGIGPDLLLSLVQRPLDVTLTAVADPDLLQQRAQQLGLPINIQQVDAPSDTPSPAGSLAVLPVHLGEAAQAGLLNANNAAYVLQCLDVASDLCLNGKADAMVTGPVHKGIINDAGIAFTGHTEYLAERCGGVHPVMMLAADSLRVALVTTHLPLREVADAITTERLERVIRILHHDLVHHFGIHQPHILICGLNPHAGEDGHLGREEIEVMQPVINACREQGMNLSDPMPADTLFTPRHLQHTDAVLAMYHDQGLPVLKHVGFGHAVNITLGLPIIRSSVDHGTALDLAGTGKADHGSLMAAIQCAGEMVSSR